jgi:hypothetical protein
MCYREIFDDYSNPDDNLYFSSYNNEQHHVILVATLKASSEPKIVGCYKINMYDKNLRMNADDKKKM